MPVEMSWFEGLGYQPEGNFFGYHTAATRTRQALEELGMKWSAKSRINFAYVAPHVYQPFPGKFNVLMTMYETRDCTQDILDRMKLADLIIVPSKWCQEYFQKWTGRKVLVVPLGTEHVPYVDRAPLIDKAEKFRFLWTGAFNARKGWYNLALTWEKFFKDIDFMELYLKTTSHGEELQKIFAPSKNAIVDARTFTREEMVKLYQESHCFVMPTLGEGWGLCVLPSTEISTRQGATHLADIQRGDEVLSQDGKFHLVMDKVTRRDSIIRVKVSGCPELGVTSVHPFYVAPGKWTPAESLRVGDYVATPRWKPESSSLPVCLDLTEWVSGLEYDATSVWKSLGYSGKNTAESLQTLQTEFHVSKRVVEDARNISTKLSYRQRSVRLNSQAAALARILFLRKLAKIAPVKIARFIPIDADFLAFMGWYLAEGSGNGGNGIEFSLHRNEESVALWIQAYLVRVFSAASTVHQSTEAQCCRLTASSSILSSLMKSLCGDGAKQKRIHAKFMVPEKIAPLLRAYIQGDGCVRGGNFQITTASQNLAWQCHRIFTSLGLRCAVRKTTQQLAPFNFVWDLIISGASAGRLARILGQADPRDTFTKTMRRHTEAGECRIDAEYLWLKVKRLTPGEETEVMDLSIQDCHSYVGNGLLLHNTSAEAMSSGCPTILPKWSGMLEYANERNCFFTPHKLDRINASMGGPSATHPDKLYEFAMCDLPMLGKTMARVMHDYRNALIVGKRAHKDLQAFTWKRTAEGIFKIIKDLN